MIARSGMAILGLVTIVAALPARGGEGPPTALARPNILWITCEDSSPNLGCYGDRFAVTPNLDRLAARGIRYTRAFSHAGVCAPSRSGLITGMYPTTLGSHHMRSIATLPEQIRPFPAYLRLAGYYCSNNAKTDYNFRVPEGTWDESSGRAHWRKRRPDQPFFSVFNLGITHESQIRADAAVLSRLDPGQRHDPARANLPPYLPESPIVRADWARYSDLITVMDMQVGDLLRQLEEDGLAEQTIVFFFSDHGVGLPRAKQWIYDAGMQVPLIIHVPAAFRAIAPGVPGSTVGRLVSFVDFGPSVLSLAGVRPPDHMQGRPFLGPLATEARRYVYGVRDRMDERYDVVRAVRDERYKYYRNYLPHLPHWPWLDYMELLATSREWRRLAAAGELSGATAFFAAPTKPLEELYDIQQDPYELHNLADSSEHRAALERLRQVHLRWVRETKDLGLLPEQDMHDRASGGAEYDMARRGDEVYPLERILEASLLVGQGPNALPAMITAMGDRDVAVRFWGAIALTNLRSAAHPAADALTRALSDRSSEVRISAAEALCGLDDSKLALAVLVESLRNPSPWVCLEAANVLDRIGEKARPVRASLQELAAIGGQEYQYVRWVLGHALRSLDASKAAERSTSQ